MITYVNTFKTNILDPLDSLLANEFNIPIHYDSDFEIRGTQFFNITPISDELIENRIGSEARSYALSIRYYRHVSGKKAKNTHITPSMEIAERLKRLIKNNSNYTSGSTYYWHDAILDNVNYNLEDDDVSPDHVIVEALFNATVEEVLS
tara:strand:- start:4313 stop:4759 length:447 start_codon:yes stop_codon:yes gene_type:complete